MNFLEYTSDLSLYCWYQDLFQRTFREALKSPPYTRFSIACVSICAHFDSCRHELCPEEFQVWLEKNWVELIYKTVFLLILESVESKKVA